MNVVRNFMVIGRDTLDGSDCFVGSEEKVKQALDGEAVEVPKDLVCNWIMAGKTSFYPGEFVDLVDDKNVSLKSPTGRTYNLSMDKLSKGSQAYARALAGGGEKEEEVAEKEFEMESWTNTKGKTIRAQFVSLEGEQITLKKADGKTVSFKLSLLSEKSQERAKELAGE